MATCASSFKGKTMASESGFFQDSFAATLLWGAALAVALVVQASPARAETLTLACESTAEGSGSALYKSPVKFRIDLDSRVVDLLTPAGGVIASTTDRKMNALRHHVKIT